ncbi:sensor histidine kinase [Actinomyces sp. Z5]|uniref:sensor histidine kinase n=1 Tax=Actinomyces sp. Z5 TaxID=2250216 RepID=UPI0011BED9D0|nr:hypothetical protein [Actinomyces sp. Z5]
MVHFRAFFDAVPTTMTATLPLKRTQLRVIALALAAGLTLTLDLHWLIASPAPISAGWEALQFVAFIAYMRNQRTGTLVYATTLAVVFLLPDAHLAWSSLLPYVAVIDLIAHRRTLVAVAVFLTVHIVQLPSADTPADVLAPMALWAVICAGVGLLLQWVGGRMNALEREAKASREAADALNRQLRRDIADTLHDDLAADLTHLLILTRQLREAAPEHESEAAAVEANARKSLGHLRALIDNLATSPHSQVEEPTIPELVATSRKALAQRSITLDADLDNTERLLPRYGPEASRLLAALIRECTVNALKYSDDGDLLSLVVEPVEKHLAITFTAPWRDREVPAELHGGHGLATLTSRFEKAGGELVASRVGESWTVLATIPIAPAPDHPGTTHSTELPERTGASHV